MNLVLWVMVGGILGCIVNVFMQTSPREWLLLDIIIGMVGAVLGGLLLAPLFGMGIIDQGNVNALSILVASIASAAMLGSLVLFRRYSTR
jgi:uncharacterized membrane protein YeaQ/YmgE (transglycosylase-associated protein family)